MPIPPTLPAAGTLKKVGMMFGAWLIGIAVVGLAAKQV